MSQGLNPVPREKCGLILGYTSRRQLLIDLDDTCLEKVHKLALMIQDQWPKVGDCLILESSYSPLIQHTRYNKDHWPYFKNQGSNYHLVFSNYTGLNYCYKVVLTLAGLDVLNYGYAKIRDFRGDMTLRVSHAVTTEGVKTPPKPVKYIRNNKCKVVDDGIQKYLRCLDAGLYLFFAYFHTEYEAYNSGDGSNDYAEILTVDTADERGRFNG